MIRFTKLFVGSAMILGAAGGATGAEQADVVLQTGALSARLSMADGRMVSLAVRGHELLAGPGRLFLQIGKRPPVPLDAKWAGLSVQRQGSGVSIVGREPDSGNELRAQWIAGRNLECRMTLLHQGPERV